MGAVARATQSARFLGSLILPLAFSVSASQVLIGESQTSFSGFLNSCCTRLPRRILQAPQPNMGYQAASSIAQRLPVAFFIGR